MLSLAGCQSLWNPGDKIDEIAYSRIPSETEATVEAVSYEPPVAETAISEEEALAGVLDELQAIGAIDPVAQQQLMDNLRDAKPEHYDLIVEQFRTALAYRNQLAARDRVNVGDPLAAASDSVAVDGPGVGDASANPSPDANAQIVHRQTSRQVDLVAPEEPARANNSATVRRLPTPPQQTVETVSHVTDRPGSLLSESTPGGDWQQQLDAAIVALSEAVVPQPRTTAELHQHFRLRALELLAGHGQEAFRPIPGATPAQQDYWAKQLYALSAFLDEQTHADDRQRAAAALVHLDEARDQLSELAVLQIRNLLFVDSVNGFGEYALREKTKFAAGEQVTLYAEVENFRSQSTAAGYQTRLGTSYQIVDQAGNRVEGGQFPDVEDLCQSRRRDFHMQYGIILPTRIYPGQYELELIVTDGQSKKIAQQRLPLEIVDSGAAAQSR